MRGKTKINMIKRILRRGMSAALATVFLVSSLAACSGAMVPLQDGVYRAETAEFDTRGYKDFLTLTITDGALADAVYDAEKEDGTLKSEDEKYAKDMQAVQETNPTKVAQDLIIQLLAAEDASAAGTPIPEGVDAVAGATYSSGTFNALLEALLPAVQSGETDTVVIENQPEI
jgi:major membrane immunogen (membrane-anchored lipoprotein)